ncbi:MAG: hypothetical protein WC708_02845 [Lentisphaeria bacterium]
MIAAHVHDALRQVQKLREAVLDKRQFRGYSGPARLLGGMVALAGAVVLARFPPATPAGHLVGWGCVLAVGLLLNYGAMAYWFWCDPQVARDPRQLRPALDALPPLAVGAAFSLACVLRQQYDELFPLWMCVYGLVHVPYRTTLPLGNYLVGLGYLAAGAGCLFWPGLGFTNPWPMGLVFFAGETVGGLILYHNRARNLTPSG